MKKAYTLIELLVVVAIITIFLSVVIASAKGAKCKENPQTCEQSVDNLKTNVEHKNVLY